MLINITIENFRSFNEAQTLSLIASSNDGISSFQIDDLEIRKSAIIYGANSSGKSNFIKSLSALQDILSGDANIDFGNLYQPFYGINLPSRVSLDFTVKQQIYTYTVSYNRYGICSEELLNRDKSIIYSRRLKQEFLNSTNESDYQYDYVIPNPELILTEDQLELQHQYIPFWQGTTNQKQLFLYKSVNEHRCEKLKPIYEALFDQKLIIRVNPYYAGRANLANLDWIYANNYYSKDNYGEIIRELNALGVNISRLEIKDVPPAMVNGSLHNKILNSIYQIGEKEFGQNFVDMESDGTIKFFNYFAIVDKLLEDGGVLIVDEFDVHFHQLLLEKIIRVINMNSKNNVQLIFTTHNSSLLDTDLFEDDQIYFVDKNDKGCSELYTLKDIKLDEDNRDNLQNKYLAGKFGSIPHLNSLLSKR